ncbi:MAG: molybdopterin-dependent oxidoreductase [Candidatus Brocadiales bacterium]
MPVVTIDNQEVEVPEKTSILNAAKQTGIEIPHFCYHPLFSVVDACRMCLVEVKDVPKLLTSCSNPVRDGMVVYTDTPKVLEARKGVLELLLLNHPMDCPVCDKAGECKLQDNYFKFSLHTSRLNPMDGKTHKPKVVDLGPKIVLDTERCIVCTRCVRFCSEVVGKEELGIFNRGDRSQVGTYNNRPLENNYQGNLTDVCPVGALTSKDFRFKARTWFLSKTDSICPGCSRGCNVQIHSTDRSIGKTRRRVYRLMPRQNEDVNKIWLCDEGRYGYGFIDAFDRLERPSVREGDGMSMADWDAALGAVAHELRNIYERHGPSSVGVLPSPQLSNEDLYAVKRFFHDALGITNIDFKLPGWNEGEKDDLLLMADRNPNSKGAELLGLSGLGVKAEEIIEKAVKGEIKALYIIGGDIAKTLGEDKVRDCLSGAEFVVYQGSNFNYACRFAHVILPSAAFAEKDGTFTNFEARVQKINKAVEPLGESLPDWEITTRLSRAMGHPLHYVRAEDVFNEISREVSNFYGLSYRKLGDKGVRLEGSGEKASA